MLPFEDLPDALESLLASRVRGKLTLAVDPKATAPPDTPTTL
jgi:hypothetical protein